MRGKQGRGEREKVRLNLGITEGEIEQMMETYANANEDDAPGSKDGSGSSAA